MAFSLWTGSTDFLKASTSDWEFFFSHWNEFRWIIQNFLMEFLNANILIETWYFDNYKFPSLRYNVVPLGTRFAFWFDLFSVGKEKVSLFNDFISFNYPALLGFLNLSLIACAFWFYNNFSSLHIERTTWKIWAEFGWSLKCSQFSAFNLEPQFSDHICTTLRSTVAALYFKVHI